MRGRYNYKIFSSATKKKEPYKLAIILGAILFGCICIVVSSFFSTPWEKLDNWRILINTVLSTLATVAFASVAWEGKVKYLFSRDVVDMVGISERLIESGIFAVEESFSDVEWADLIEGAKSITAVFTYSTKWGKDNRDRIKTAVENGCKVVVALPDINSSGLIENLKYRFSGVSDVKTEIEKAEEFYLSIGAKIQYYSRAITSSFYLIDDVGIIVPFNHQKAFGGHAPSVPAFMSLKPGYIYRFIEKEVTAILETPEEGKGSACSEELRQQN